MDRLRICGAARRRSALEKLAHGRAVPGAWPVRVAPGPAGKLEFVPDRAPIGLVYVMERCGGEEIAFFPIPSAGRPGAQQIKRLRSRRTIQRLGAAPKGT